MNVYLQIEITEMNGELLLLDKIAIPAVVGLETQ